MKKGDKVKHKFSGNEYVIDRLEKERVWFRYNDSLLAWAYYEELELIKENPIITESPLEFRSFVKEKIVLNEEREPKETGMYRTNLGERYFKSSNAVWFLNGNSSDLSYPTWWVDMYLEKEEFSKDKIEPSITSEKIKAYEKNVGGYRYNADKLDWSLVDFNSLESLVQVLEFGAKKYARDNWKKGLKFNDTINSLMRHLIKFKEVGDNDEESGLCHLGHIMANTMFLQYMLKNNKGVDDRNLPKNDEKN